MQYYDNTMISGARECLRKYYFRHIKNWRGKGTALPLTFGLSWHDAMDRVWGLADSNKSDMEILDIAHNAFIETWCEDGLPHPDNLPFEKEQDMRPRTPGIAREMLHNYIAARRHMIAHVKIVAIEQPFAVPIYKNKDVMYIGRLDKVFENNSGIIIGEHKTTSFYAKESGFRNEFVNSFSPNSQVDGYLHAGHMIYGKDLKSVWVDAALVHKTVHDKFKFIPVDRLITQLDAWLADTKNWIEIIEIHLQKLADSRVGKSVGYMTAFPKNTNACYNFMKPCAYMDVCKFVADPDNMEMPDNFIEEKWVPFDILKIEKLGLRKEES